MVYWHYILYHLHVTELFNKVACVFEYLILPEDGCIQ